MVEKVEPGTQASRPRVIVHNSASIDGRVAISPGVPLMADPRWPATSGYGAVMARHRPTVLLEGAGSFVVDDGGRDDGGEDGSSGDGGSGDGGRGVDPRRDDDGETDFHQDFVPAAAIAAAHAGWLVVTDSRGRVHWQFKQFPDPEWSGWHVLVLVSRGTPVRYLRYLREQEIPYLVAGKDRVDLGRALAALGERFSVRCVVATGGARLGGALLRAGLVDEIEVEVLPIAVGGETTPALFTAPDLGGSDPVVPLQLVEVSSEEGRVLLRYLVQDKALS